MLSNKELAAQVRALVAKGELKEAIGILQEHSAVQEKIDQVVMYAARFRDLEEQELNNTIDYNTLSIQKNQLRQDILRIVKGLDDVKKDMPLNPAHSSPASAPVKKKNNTPLIIGIGLLVVALGIGLMVINNLNSNGSDHRDTDTLAVVEEHTDNNTDDNIDDSANNTELATPTKPLDQVVEVSNIKELLEAIKSNTTIRLKPGEYDLETGTAMLSNENVKLRPTKLGFNEPGLTESGLTFTDLEKLTLIGAEGSGLRTRLITGDVSADVLRLVDCKDIVFQNIFFGHKRLALCLGGVFDLIDCERIKFDNCVLHGSGTIGIYTDRTSGLEFADSDIQECSVGLVLAKNSANFHFHGSSFIESHGAVGFDFETTSNVRFDDCIIKDNEYAKDLFYVKRPRIVLNKVEIANTTYMKLIGGMTPYVEQTDVVIK